MTDSPDAADLFADLGDELLRQQLVALLDDKTDVGRKRRRGLTLFAADCRQCDKPLIEVLATRPYWVLRHRQRVNGANRDTENLYDRPEGLSSTEWAREVIRRRQAAGVTCPDGEGPWMFFPITRERQLEWRPVFVESVWV